MTREARAIIPIKDLKSIIFDRERGNAVITKEIPDEPQPPEFPRFTSVNSWWNGKEMSRVINSCINIWLNNRGIQSANDEGMDLNVAVTNAADEARYSDELEDALKSAQGSHINADRILFKVKLEARRIALDKRPKVTYIGEYLVDFVDVLGDVYGLTSENRKRLKRLASYSKLAPRA